MRLVMSYRTRTTVYSAIVVIVAAFACLLLFKNTLSSINNPVVSVTAATVTAATSSETIPDMHFEVVTDPAAQEKGLGGRADIPHDYGMLFVFPKDDTYGFWMKDMLVPIDIIWLSDNGTILGIEDSVEPTTYPNVFYSPKPVQYVLETRAGESHTQGWTTGSIVNIPLQN